MCQRILLLSIVLMFASCQKNDSEKGKTSETVEKPAAVSENAAQNLPGDESHQAEGPLVEPDLFPHLRWGMNVSRIRALYSPGTYDEFAGVSGLWQYRFEMGMKQFGTPALITYSFPSKGEPKGAMSVSFAPCKTPVIRNNELAMSLDCVELRRMIMQYMNDKYGKPSTKKNSEIGSLGYGTITYTWFSKTSKIEMTDDPIGVMLWIFHPK